MGRSLKVNKFAMVTRCDNNAKELADVTHEILKDYAGQWGCDFIILDKKEDWMTDYELAHYRIFEVRELLEKYERVLVIDSDIVIMPGCPNPFEIVPVDKIGSIYEDIGSRHEHRGHVIQDIQRKFGDVGWRDGYINTGFFVVSRVHRDIFQRIDNQLWTAFGYDDALIGYNIHKFNHEVHELPFQFNHMSMFSEPWNNSASRFDSWIIHYAGAANFPDDQSGRGLLNPSNAMEGRIQLIKNDIDRITEGLMTFKDAKPTEIQGLGSRCLDVKIGVQEKDIVLKVPNTEECLKRELEVLNMRIPNTVTFLGMGEDGNLGKFLMLEKLYPLEKDIGHDRMVNIASTVMTTSRQLWKLGIPWICKEEHIMQDENGNIKLIDFGDDPYMPIPFYGKTDDTEAIIMDGDCCKDGKYQMRYKYPLSGFVAVMKNMCHRNDLPMSLLMEAEIEMIAHEYQSLKDVHQPIWFEDYNHIYRTETEPNDKNFGKSVPANRNCEDRAAMLYENAEPWMTHETTWLDIGCNVGWFCFEFADKFKMTGIDFDHDKILFNKMMAEGQRVDVNFIHADVTPDYVDTMPEYDIISVMSMLHLKLVADKDSVEFWKLFRAIAKKANKMMFFEFPPHSYSLAGSKDIHSFMENVKRNGEFKSVGQIGITDAGRPMLKCLK
jgi:SAM-dependent methyltransferase